MMSPVSARMFRRAPLAGGLRIQMGPPGSGQRRLGQGGGAHVTGGGRAGSGPGPGSSVTREGSPD